MLPSVVNHSDTSCQSLGGSLLSQELTPLQSALTKNALITLLESALTKTRGLKSFRIRTYEKRWGERLSVLSSGKRHEFVAHLPRFGVEANQQLVSQGPANNFF